MRVKKSVGGLQQERGAEGLMGIGEWKGKRREKRRRKRIWVDFYTCLLLAQESSSRSSFALWSPFGRSSSRTCYDPMIWIALAALA